MPSERPHMLSLRAAFREFDKKTPLRRIEAKQRNNETTKQRNNETRNQDVKNRNMNAAICIDRNKCFSVIPMRKKTSHFIYGQYKL